MMLSLPVPGFLQGVSQQPDAMRLSSQASLQENAFPSISDGLTKRHPLDHIGVLRSDSIGATLTHFVDRSTSERYAVLVNSSIPASGTAFQAVRAFDLLGTEYLVRGPGNTTPDFSYLNLYNTGDNLISEGQEDFNSGGSTKWTLNGQALAPSNLNFVGPFGYRNDASHVTQVHAIGTSAGAASQGQYGKGPTGSVLVKTFPSTGGVTFSLYVKQVAADVGNNLAASQFQLDLRDVSLVLAHSATFAWTAGVLAVSATAGGATGAVQYVANGWYRASVTFQVGAVGGGATSNTSSIQVNINSPDFNGANLRRFLAWGAMLNYGTVAKDYVLPPTKYARALTIADFTFVLNTTKTTAMGGATSATDPSPNKAFLFVRQGGYKANYNVTLERSSDSVRSASVVTWNGQTSVAVQDVWTLQINTIGSNGSTWTVTIQGTAVTHVVNTGIDTVNSIALDLKNKIDALDNVSAIVATSTVTIKGDFAGMKFTPTASNSGGGTDTLTHTQSASSTETNSIKTDDIATSLASKISALSGYTATAQGSVIRIVSSTAFVDVECTDSLGDTALVAIWKSVPTVDTLPLVCEDGFIVTILGDPGSNLDDYNVKFTADKSGSFGLGKWVETIGFAVKYQLDATTLPYQLTRKQDDAGGTVTGVAFGKYFEWGPVTWIDRGAGNDTSAPIPSFVGDNLSDIFFFKNRLGFLAGQNVVMSEASRYFNFFRTTTVQLLDSDPIDVEAVHTVVSNLQHAVPFNDTLVLFSDRTQFLLDGNPILTPKTVQVVPSTEYLVDPNTLPVATAQGIYFNSPRAGYSGVREFAASTQVANEFVVNDVSAQVPKYIPGTIFSMAPAKSEDCLVCATDGDDGALYVYKFFVQNGAKIQSAWSRFVLNPDSSVVGLGFFDSSLYVVVQHDTQVTLERIEMSPSASDPQATSLTYIDRRVPFGPDGIGAVSFNGGTNQTTCTMPYTIAVGDTIQAATRAFPGFTTIQSITVVSATGTTVVLSGNWASTPIYVGSQYTMRYRFTSPTLRDAAQNGKTPYASGRLQVHSGRLVYDKSTYFRVDVSPLLGTSRSYPFSKGTLYPSGIHPFTVLKSAGEFTADIVNDSPFPSNFVSAEWIADFQPKTARAPN